MRLIMKLLNKHEVESLRPKTVKIIVRDLCVWREFLIDIHMVENRGTNIECHPTTYEYPRGKQLSYTPQEKPSRKNKKRSEKDHE